MDLSALLGRFAFEPTDEQLLIGQTAWDFAAARLAPGAAARDRDHTFPHAELAEAAELGLLSMKVPAGDGGVGADNVSYVLAMHGLGRACASTAVIVAATNLALSVLAKGAGDAQRARWLAPRAEGAPGPVSFALSEPSCGSDAAALRTAARPEGDGWVLDGGKMWITAGAHAGLHVVFARTDPGAGSRGVSCFVVERGVEGLTVGREEDKMGQRASGTVALHFDGCRLPASSLVGARGGGLKMALVALEAGRVGIAGMCLGLAEAALALGAGYAAERTAFGQRVADFQNTRFALADSRVELDAAWLLTLRAARLLDRGGRHPAAASAAKLYASEAACRIIDRMLQLHGGYGYSREYTIERLYRDARVTRIYEGSSEIQRLLIARDVLAGLAPA